MSIKIADEQIKAFSTELYRRKTKTTEAKHLTEVLEKYEESKTDDQVRQLAEERGFTVGKRVMFVPNDESTYPKPFTWVKTSLGFGMHRYLTDNQRMKDESWDCWSFVENDKDEATRFIGYNTDEPDTEVEWWEQIL